MATVLVNVGKALVTGFILGAGATEPHHVALGVGTGTAAITDTTLFTEAESRVVGTSTQQTVTTTNDTYQVVGTITATAARIVRNAGLFTDASAGTLFVKGDFSDINLAIGDSIQFTIKCTFS
jgi:hypothetical protein